MLRPFKSVLLALALACLGFSFSLATAPDSASRQTQDNSHAAPRTIGSGLRFSNPPLLPGQDSQFPNGGLTNTDPQGFDLGDACFGSQIVRYLTAVGGVEPFSFSALNSTAFVGLSVSSNGIASGTIPATLGTSVAKFSARVDDSAGAFRTGIFRLTAFNSAATPFRFAQDRVSDGRVGQDYATNLQVLNGDPAKTIFSVVAGSVKLDGAAAPDLGSLGINLFNDGTLAGRPVKSGTITFTARATFNGVNNARNRADTSPDQPLSLLVETPKTMQSVLAAISSTLTLNASRPGHDALSLTAYTNSNGRFVSDYANLPFTLRIGAQTFTVTLDKFGQSRKGNLKVFTSAPGGGITISMRNQNFSALFSGITLADKSTRIVPVEIEIGGVYLGTEALEYSVKNRNGHAQLKYMLNRNRQVGGLFQLIGVDAANLSSGTVAYRMTLVAAPAAIAQGGPLTGATQATVSIGPGFTEQLKLIKGNNVFFTAGVASFRTRGRVIQITTYGLTSAQTGIMLTGQSGKPQNLQLGLQVVTPSETFNGEGSALIFPF